MQHTISPKQRFKKIYGYYRAHYNNIISDEDKAKIINPDSNPTREKQKIYLKSRDKKYGAKVVEAARQVIRNKQDEQRKERLKNRPAPKRPISEMDREELMQYHFATGIYAP